MVKPPAPTHTHRSFDNRWRNIDILYIILKGILWRFRFNLNFSKYLISRLYEQFSRNDSASLYVTSSVLKWTVGGGALDHLPLLFSKSVYIWTPMFGDKQTRKGWLEKLLSHRKLWKSMNMLLEFISRKVIKCSDWTGQPNTLPPRSRWKNLPRI